MSLIYADTLQPSNTAIAEAGTKGRFSINNAVHTMFQLLQKPPFNARLRISVRDSSCPWTVGDPAGARRARKDRQASSAVLAAIPRPGVIRNYRTGVCDVHLCLCCCAKAYPLPAAVRLFCVCKLDCGHVHSGLKGRHGLPENFCRASTGCLRWHGAIY